MDVLHEVNLAVDEALDKGDPRRARRYLHEWAPDLTNNQYRRVLERIRGHEAAAAPAAT